MKSLEFLEQMSLDVLTMHDSSDDHILYVSDVLKFIKKFKELQEKVNEHEEYINYLEKGLADLGHPIDK